jgi:hypothetical protein
MKIFDQIKSGGFLSSSTLQSAILYTAGFLILNPAQVDARGEKSNRDTTTPQSGCD